MNKKSPYALALAVFLSLLLSVPADLWAAPQSPNQRAGEVSRVIPAVSIDRNSKTIKASAKTVVNWQDLVNTQVNARARIALDDGSVLNVGSESSMKVVKHDAGAQQTELELAYGKLRTQAQKISKPDGKFEVRTPAGVAGVVGTDFMSGYDVSTKTMTVVVFEGIVKFCNLAGVCVVVKAGQMSNVRNGDNSAPQAPVQAPLDLLVASSKDTDAGGNLGVAQVGQHAGLGTWIAVGVLAAIPAIAIGVAVSRPGPGTPPVAPPPKCGPSAC
jgi:hypothetical protein